MDGFLEDVAEILREGVDELVRLGTTYIQLDAPHYPLLLDPTTREFHERRGWDFDRWMTRGIELDNHAMGDHPGATFAFHLCRETRGAAGWSPAPPSRSSRSGSSTRLALSPQCGFATSVIGNAVTVGDEEHKLRVIVETPERAWG